MKTAIVAVFFSLGIFGFTQAQIKYGVESGFVLTNYIESGWVSALANEHLPTMSFNLGGNAGINLWKSDFNIQVGILYTYWRVKMKIPDAVVPHAAPYVDRLSWTEKFHSFDMPLIIQYKYEEWLVPNIGLVGSFNICDEFKNHSLNLFSYGWTAGVDFFIYKHYIIGAKYFKELTPMGRNINENNCYRQYYGLKLGYLF